MDEVVTCKCGSQAWVLGTSGTRCNKCGFWLPSRIQVNIHDAQQYVDRNHKGEQTNGNKTSTT